MYVRCDIYMCIFWRKKDVLQSRYDQRKYFILTFTLLYNSYDVFNRLHVCMVMSIRSVYLKNFILGKFVSNNVLNIVTTT